MNLLHTVSLAATLDAVNDAVFSPRKMPLHEVRRTARWMANRQGLPGSYSGMFAPTEKDFTEGITLFTGERMRSGAGVGHTLGEETCRALRLLDCENSQTAEALARATASMEACLSTSEAKEERQGFYCCGTCTASLWRHLAAGGLSQNQRRLAGGLRILKEHRLDDGTWRRFPFYYTLLALSEMPGKHAVKELQYAAPGLERLLRRRARGDKYDDRRRMLAERVLATV